MGLKEISFLVHNIFLAKLTEVMEVYKYENKNKTNINTLASEFFLTCYLFSHFHMLGGPVTPP